MEERRYKKMVLTTLALGAATAFAQGMSGQLGTQAAAAFKHLREAIWRRLAGDQTAEGLLAAVEQNPRDEGACRELAQVLEYYAGRDRVFADYLARTVRYIQYADNSSRGSWNVGRDNQGTINNRVDDHRSYQTGGYRAGRDFNINQSKYDMELDPIRSATGIPKGIMVFGMLLGLAGIAVFFSAIAQDLMSVSLGPSPDEGVIMQRAVIGFGIAFVGAIVFFIGSVFRPKDR